MPGKGKPRAESRRAAPPAQAAYISLIGAADAVRTFFESVCAPYDLTRQQYNVLRILRGAGTGGVPTLVIAERMLERTPGVTRIVDRLEAKGLVTREVRPDDRRFVFCHITDKGLALLALLDAPVEEANRAAFAGLGEDELAQLVPLLEKVRRALAAPAEEKQL